MEAEPEVIQKFGRWAAAKVKKLKEAARTHESDYLRQEEEQYNAGMHREGTLTKKLHVFIPGQLVMAKIPAVGAFGQRSKGPLVVLLDKGDSIKAKNLLTGRIGWENKSNCLPLRTVMKQQS